MKRKNILVDSYTILMTFLILTLISKVLLLRLSVLIGKNATLITDWKVIIIIFILLILGFIFHKANKSIKVNGYILVFLSLLIFTLQWWVAVNNVNNFEVDGIEAVIQIFLRYFWIYLICLVILIKINTINIKLLIRTTILFVLLNTTLGIFQFVLRDPLLETAYKGEPIVNSIFYKDGISSSYNWLYELGANVRAFGFVDSGLTLGFLITLAISIVFSQVLKLFQNKPNDNFRYRLFMLLLLIIIFISALYMTLTRNVYLTFFNLVLFYLIIILFKERAVSFLKILFILEWNVGVGYILFAENIYEKLVQWFPNANFETLHSRINTYNRLANLDNNNFLNFLFGKGIAPSSKWVIDNDILSISSHIGFLPYLMMQLILVWIIWSGFRYLQVNYSKRKKDYKYYYLQGFLVFLATYPMAATLNYVSYVYFCVALLALFILYSDYSESISIKYGQ